MPEDDLNNPATPFLEMWAFRISLSPSPRSPNAPRDPWQIRHRVIQHLRGMAEGPMQSEGADVDIWNEIREIVTDHLSSPDYQFFITDFEEHPGSWEIVFVVVGAFYGGVCGYGSFRQGLEYVFSDLKAAFGAVEGLRTRVRKRFKERHVLAKPRVEPTVDWNETDVKS